MSASQPAIAGLVLAGGRGSRLGADGPKPLVVLGGRSLLARVLLAFPAGIDPVLISANDSLPFAHFGLPVIADTIEGFAGPLAGLEAAAAHLKAQRPEITHLLCLPGDTPFLPADLAARLSAEANDRPLVARYRGQLHPTVALWPLSALGGLAAFLRDGGKASILRFLSQTGMAALDIADVTNAPEGDPFFNVNTPQDLAAARLFLTST